MGETTTPQAAEPGAHIVNRRQVVEAVIDKTGLPPAKATAAVEAVFACLATGLQEGKELRLAGFGAFAVVDRPAGSRRDPQSGAAIDTPQGRVVRFRPGKLLREMVAGKAV